MAKKSLMKQTFSHCQRSSSWTWEIPKSIIWKSALDRSRLSNYSWTEKKLKKTETTSPARKVSKLNSFSSIQYRDKVARYTQKENESLLFQRASFPILH